MNSSTQIEKLNNTVIKGGYCIGCGICTTVNNSPFKMNLDKFSRLQATMDNSINLQDDAEVLDICPFSDMSENEDEIGESLYGNENKKHDELGYIGSTFAGYVSEKKFRNKGSSGGMGTWILAQLLNQNLVDGIIHVKPSEGKVLFKYAISRTLEEVSEGSSSRYYPIEMSQVIDMVKNKPGRYAVVGLPCFIKGIRLLAKQDSIINERIKFCVGLFCGHLKSSHFASMWAWQLGMQPDKLERINFRHKLDNANASRYAVEIKGEINGKETSIVSPPLNELYGSSWGWGFFKYKACDYCDDVVAETADISIGDAWLPKYVKDSNGTNVIVVRNRLLLEIVNKGRNEKRLNFEEISPEEVVQSQSSGFNHRRAGLAYRLFLKDQSNEWRPTKRVKPSSEHLNRNIKLRQHLRIKLADKSHIAFQEALDKDDFNVFKEKMNPIVNEYEALYNVSFVKRVINRLKRYLNSFR